jgi:hypothetical protein
MSNYERIATCRESQCYLCRVVSAANLPNVVLCLIGLGAVWAALSTLNAIKRQAATMERQLILTQRPKIIVRGFYFNEIHAGESTATGIKVGSRCFGRFFIANSGGSDAHINEIYRMVWIVPVDGPLTAKPVYENQVAEHHKITIRPGQAGMWEFGRADALLPETRQDLHFGNAKLYVIGWIDYSDDLGISRRMAFCRRYHPSKDRFLPKRDAYYEYSE